MKATLHPSFHCIEDRSDRIVFIATTIGFGEEVHRKVWYSADGRPCYRCITDTGIIIVRSVEDDNFIITMFIATVAQAQQMYGGGHVPQYLYNKVRKNQKYAQQWNKRQGTKMCPFSLATCFNDVKRQTP